MARVRYNGFMKLGRGWLVVVVLVGWLVSVLIGSPGISLAQEATDSASIQVDEEAVQKLQSKIEELQKKINDLQQQEKSLSGTIEVLDNKIYLNEAEISKTEQEISILERQIDGLSQRIEGLELSLEELSVLLIDRIQQQYKQTKVDPISSLLAADGLSGFIRQQRYVKQARSHTEDLMFAAEYKRQVYDEEKDRKQTKQDELEVLRNRLSSQQHELNQQKQAKQQLLRQTQNDEETFSRLLAEAKAELNALSNFSSGRTNDGVLPPQNSPDGWFYSQRDQRWADTCVGLACEYNIYEVGCLISSTAMVMKKYGENVNPITIASNPSYFFGTTAYMLRPYPSPAGHQYYFSGYNAGLIDSQLEQGKPVIVKLSVSTQYATHFVVLKAGQGGDYTMHDPWEGYDKKFKDFYSTGQIISVAYLN